MNFESELSKGNFVIPECSSCKKIVWPPTESCDVCYASVSLKRGDFEGKILEFSKHGDGYFCIVEFENAVRIMGKMSKPPTTNQSVKISKCGISNEGYFFHIS